MKKILLLRGILLLKGQSVRNLDLIVLQPA